MILSMWKNILFSDKRFFMWELKKKVPLMFRIHPNQGVFYLKLVYLRLYKFPFTKIIHDYNNLIILCTDICIEFIKTNYTPFFIPLIFWILLYFIISWYYICIKYTKKYCSLYDLIIHALLHSRLLFLAGTYLSIIIWLTPYINHLLHLALADVGEGEKYINLLLNFIKSDWGGFISIIIMVYLLSFLITVLVVKTDKNTWLKYFYFLISSLILRSILLDIFQFLPSDISEIGIDILTAKLVFGNLFKEYFSEHFKNFISQVFPVYYCDTPYSTWREYVNTQAALEQNKTTSLRALNKYAVAELVKNPSAVLDLLYMRLGYDNINSLSFLYERTWGKVFTLVRGDDNNLYPFPYGSLLPDFFNGESPNFAPFPFTDTVKIPGYDMMGAYPDIPSLVEANNSEAYYPKPNTVIISSVGYYDEGEKETAHFYFKNRIDITPTVVRDWNNQTMVYIDMGNGLYQKYNPYYITDSMLDKRIVVKMKEGVYEETYLKVQRLYKPNEINWRTSEYSRYWKFSINHLESIGKPYVLSDCLRLVSSLENSPILNEIDLNHINWR